VLAQKAKNSGSTFNVVLVADSKYKDVELTAYLGVQILFFGKASSEKQSTLDGMSPS
jgi:hypothetical protein